MEEKLFNELVESIKEVGAVLRGELEPARVTILEKPVDSRLEAQPDSDPKERPA
jgi:hypothetical protein